MNFWNNQVVPFFTNLGKTITEFWTSKAVPFFSNVGEKIVDFWNNTALPFLKQGNNKYYVIAGAVALVALIIILSVVGARAKKKKIAQKKKAKRVTPVAEERYIPAEVNIPGVKPVDASVAHPSVEKIEEISGVRTHMKVSHPVAEDKREVERKKIAEISDAELEARIKAHDEEVKAKEELEKATGNGKIQIYKDSGLKYRFRFTASNGTDIAHGQNFVTKAACKSALKGVVGICADAVVFDTTKAGSDYVPTVGKCAFEVYRDSDNRYRFRLRAASTQIVLMSYAYTAKASCLNGIKSARTIATTDEIVDVTESAE